MLGVKTEKKAGGRGMKQTGSLSELSRLSGVHKSTVSRALNYCGGVAPATAERIRRLAAETGYAVPRAGTPECAVILPQNEAFFWSAAKDGIFRVLQEGGVRFCAGLYPDLFCGEDFLQIWQSMIRKKPRLILLAARCTPEVCERMGPCPVPVFFLGEFFGRVNSFYFGADPDADGQAMAQGVLRYFPARKRVLLVQPESTVMAKRRMQAFLRALPETTVAAGIQLEGGSRCTASLLAREIAASGASFDYLYCGDNCLPQVCLAMDKLHLPPDIFCIGYENPPANEPYLQNGRIAFLLEQDIAAQSRLCAEAACTYLTAGVFPPRKYNCIPPPPLLTGARFGGRERSCPSGGPLPEKGRGGLTL